MTSELIQFMDFFHRMYLNWAYNVPGTGSVPVFGLAVEGYDAKSP